MSAYDYKMSSGYVWKNPYYGVQKNGEQFDVRSKLLSIPKYDELLERLKAKYLPIIAASQKNGHKLQGSVKNQTNKANPPQTSAAELVSEIIYNVNQCSYLIAALSNPHPKKLPSNDIVALQRSMMRDLNGIGCDIDEHMNNEYDGITAHGNLQIINSQSKQLLERVKKTNNQKPAFDMGFAFNPSLMAFALVPSPIIESLTEAAKWVASKIKDAPKAQTAVKVLAGVISVGLWLTSTRLALAGKIFDSYFFSAALGILTTASTCFCTQLWDALKYKA